MTAPVFDHLLATVRDPALVTEALAGSGLRTVPGPTVYSGLGTVLVPLRPPEHVRVLYPVDPGLAVDHPWAARILRQPTDELLLVGWALEVDDLTEVVRRTGARPLRQSIVYAADDVETWDAVADHESFAESPILVRYPRSRPERAANWHRRPARLGAAAGDASIEYVETAATDSTLRLWLGGRPTSVRTATVPGLSAVGLRGGDGRTHTIRSTGIVPS